MTSQQAYALHTKWSQLKMRLGQSVDEFAVEFSTTLAVVESMKVNLGDDKEIALAFLQKLHGKYSSMYAEYLNDVQNKIRQPITNWKRAKEMASSGIHAGRDGLPGPARYQGSRQQKA